MTNNPVNDQQPHERITCGARTRTGGLCKRAPVPGRTRCKLHGGATPTGIASPHWRTGQNSRTMPRRLIERYEQSLDDPDLLALRREIALCDSRLDDLLQRVDTGEAGSLWNALRLCYSNLRAANAAEDPAAAAEALNQIGQLIGRGQADYASWGEIAHWQEQRRRLSETEAKRLVAMQNMISSEKALAMITAISLVIKRHVTDQAALRAIAQELRVLSNRPEFGSVPGATVEREE